MLGQTQSGRLYQPAVSSFSHGLQVLLQVRGQLPGVLFSVGAVLGSATAQHVA